MLTPFRRNLLLGWLAALLSIGSAQAQTPPPAPATRGAAGPALQRPDVGLVRLIADRGWATFGGGRHGNVEGGIDLLLSVNDKQRYGVRLSALDIDGSGQHRRYVSTGLVLEMVLFGWFRTEIGTVGFVGLGESRGRNPFGLISFLGYERRVGRWNLSVGYDSKVIFAKPTIFTSNLGAGLGAGF